jgi:AhpD family alkylhydroperoxidase
MNFTTASHDVFEAMKKLQQAVDHIGLDAGLLNLVYLLVSRVNGCAYCIDMHSQELRAQGETELRINLVSVWEEVDIYSEKERAAFAWAESVTKVSQTHVPDEVYNRARQHFSSEELAKLTLAIVTINGWNRFAISFRAEPGHDKPAKTAAARTSVA